MRKRIGYDLVKLLFLIPMSTVDSHSVQIVSPSVQVFSPPCESFRLCGVLLCNIWLIQVKKLPDLMLSDKIIDTVQSKCWVTSAVLLRDSRTIRSSVLIQGYCIYLCRQSIQNRFSVRLNVIRLKRFDTTTRLAITFV
jgi:hypothetical protein